MLLRDELSFSKNQSTRLHHENERLSRQPSFLGSLTPRISAIELDYLYLEMQSTKNDLARANEQHETLLNILSNLRRMSNSGILFFLYSLISISLCGEIYFILFFVCGWFVCLCFYFP